MDLENTLDDLAPRLLRYCRGLAGDPSLAEEVAQDALTALVSRWRRLGPPDEPAAFAFVVARRRLRRAQWRRRLFEPLEAVFGQPSPTADPEEKTTHRRRLESTLQALDGLPVDQREALLLVVGGELDGESAARVLGISRSALKMRVHRARRGLELEVNDV